MPSTTSEETIGAAHDGVPVEGELAGLHPGRLGGHIGVGMPARGAPVPMTVNRDGPEGQMAVAGEAKDFQEQRPKCLDRERRFELLQPHAR